MQRRNGKPSTFVDFREVRSAVPIESVLEYYGLLAQLQRKEDGYAGDCPFHEGESRRPFHVSLSKNAWYCFGCEEGGNVLDFVARKEDVSVKKAALLLVEWFQLKLGESRGRPSRPASSREAPKQDAPPPESSDLTGPSPSAPQTSTPNSGDRTTVASPGGAFNPPLGFNLKHLDPAHEALRPLGFDPALIERFEAGYCDRGLMKGRLAIPIHSLSGALLAYAGVPLDGAGEIKYPPKFDRQLELYNLHRAIEPARLDGLLLAPHLLDVWRLTAAGFENAVALTSDDMSDRQQELLISFAGKSQRILVLSMTSARHETLLSRLVSKVSVQTLELEELLA